MLEYPCLQVTHRFCIQVQILFIPFIILLTRNFFVCFCFMCYFIEMFRRFDVNVFSS